MDLRLLGSLKIGELLVAQGEANNILSNRSEDLSLPSLCVLEKRLYIHFDVLLEAHFGCHDILMLGKSLEVTSRYDPSCCLGCKKFG